MQLTPHNIAVLMDIHTGPTTIIGSDGALNLLEKYGLIEPAAPCMVQPALPPGSVAHGRTVTEKGRVFIERVLSTPLPVQTWGYPS